MNYHKEGLLKLIVKDQRWELFIRQTIIHTERKSVSKIREIVDKFEKTKIY